MGGKQPSQASINTPPSSDCQLIIKNDNLQDFNMIICGFSRSGKTTLIDCLCDKKVAYTPTTKNPVYRKGIISSDKYCYNIIDLPGWYPNITYPMDTITPSIQPPIHAIIVTLDISDARSWPQLYEQQRTLVNKLEGYCTSKFRLCPVIILVVTKCDLTPMEVASFGRTPEQTWFEWKNNMKNDNKLIVWELVKKTFGELFKNKWMFLVSVVSGKNSWGVSELIDQLKENPYERSKLEILYDRMNKNLDCVERDLRNFRIPNIEDYSAYQIFMEKYKEQTDELIKTIRKDLGELLSPDRPFNLAVVGTSNWGKTTIINTLTQKECGVIKKTVEPIWIKVDESLNILDTIGIEPGSDNYPGENKLEEAIKAQRPDVILMVADSSKFHHWKSYVNMYDKILKIIQNASNNQIAPIICVITKLDNADMEDIPRKSNETFRQWKERFTVANKDKINLEYIEKFKQEYNESFGTLIKPTFIAFTAISGKDSYGVLGSSGLLDQITSCTDINTSVCKNKESRYINRRRNLASKIIMKFTAIGSFVSLFPFVDIFLVPIIATNMIILLECLSTHPDRNAKSYLRANKIVIGIVSGLRTGAFITMAILDLTLVGAAISVPAGVALAASTISLNGIHAYNYFTEDVLGDKKLEEEKDTEKDRERGRDRETNLSTIIDK